MVVQQNAGSRHIPQETTPQPWRSRSLGRPGFLMVCSDGWDGNDAKTSQLLLLWREMGSTDSTFVLGVARMCSKYGKRVGPVEDRGMVHLNRVFGATLIKWPVGEKNEHAHGGIPLKRGEALQPPNVIICTRPVRTPVRAPSRLCSPIMSQCTSYKRNTVEYFLAFAH